MFGRCGNIVLGVIERNLATSAPVNSSIEITWIKSCDKVKAFSTSTFLLTGQKKQEESSESACNKKDVYKVSPLCAPKGYRYKGIIPSLKCPPKCKSEAEEVKADTPPRPPPAEAPASTPPPPPHGQVPPKAPGPAGLSPQLDGITPVKKDLKTDPKEAVKKDTTSENSPVCEKKTNIFTKWMAKRKAKAEAKKECKKKKKLKKKQKKCKQGSQQSEETGSKPTTSATQVEEVKPGKAVKPGEAEKSPGAAKPVTGGQSGKGAKPAEGGKCSEAAKPAEAAKPTEVVKQADSKSTGAPGEKPCPKQHPTDQAEKQANSTVSQETKQSVSSAEKFCPKGNAEALKQAKSSDGSGEKPSGGGSNTSNTLKSVAASFMQIHYFSTESSGKSGISCQGGISPSSKQTPTKDAAPSDKQETPPLSANSEGNTPKGDAPCPPSVGPILASPQYSNNNTISCPKEPSKRLCPKIKIKLPDTSQTIDTGKEESERKPCKVDLGCKTKRSDSPSGIGGKAPCLKTRRELNEKCPDFKAFLSKESSKKEPCPEQPCSTLPWPLNVLQDMRQCKKAQKEKCKKLKEEKCKQKKVAKKECQVQKCLAVEVPLLKSFIMSEAFIKSALFGVRNFHTSLKIDTKPDCKGGEEINCPTEKCTFKKCDVVKCDEKMEQEMKNLRDKARHVEEVNKPEYNLCLPPDSWEPFPSFSLTTEHKIKTDKVYEQPRFVSRRLRKSKIC